ncbi:hypothetical protein B0H21DRAFT_706129 [Amylocystis lapponica]|nr:hypothetical protein B0H21DRAFT_706129 [Amylocystis lapponica]
MFKDAQNLLGCLLARRINYLAYPDQLQPTGAVLRLAPAVPARPPPGRIECATTTCYTQSRKRTQGNRECVGLTFPSSQNLPPGLCSEPPQAVPPPPGPPAPSGSPPRAQKLAQPIGPLWNTALKTAQANESSAKSMKVKAQELDQRSKRTITMVVWHEDGREPLRFQEYLDTFPKIQLQSAQQLDLLTTWTDCPGLPEELQRQSRQAKRGGTDLVSPLKKAPRVDDADTHTRRPASPIPEKPRTSQPSSVIEKNLPSVTHGHCDAKAKSKRTPDLDAGSHSSHRKWPAAFYVSEIVDGFTDMKCRLKSDRKGKLTTKQAFRDVFGVRQVRTTYNAHRNLWNDAPEKLKNQFYGYGDTHPTLFGCGNAPNTCFEPPFAIVHDPAARRSHSCSPRHCSTSLFPPLRRQSSTPVLYGTIDALRIRSTSATSPRDCSQDPPTLCCVLTPNGHAERTFTLRI